MTRIMESAFPALPGRCKRNRVGGVSGALSIQPSYGAALFQLAYHDRQQGLTDVGPWKSPVFIMGFEKDYDQQFVGELELPGCVPGAMLALSGRPQIQTGFGQAVLQRTVRSNRFLVAPDV